MTFFFPKTEFKTRAAIYKGSCGTMFWPKIEIYSNDDKSRFS